MNTAVDGTLMFVIDPMLQLHVLGLVFFIGYVVSALIMIVRRKGSSRFIKNFAGAIATYQISTGLLLSLLNPAVTLQSVCVRGLVLLGVLYFLSVSVSHRIPAKQTV